MGIGRGGDQNGVDRRIAKDVIGRTRLRPVFGGQFGRSRNVDVLDGD